MEPGIQFMLRMEREAEVQRRPYVSYRDGLEVEKPAHSLEQGNPIKHIFNLFRQKLMTRFQQGTIRHSSGSSLAQRRQKSS